MTKRQCTKCLQTKPLEEFAKAGSGPQGRSKECKICMAGRARKYYATHKEEAAAKQRKYRAEHKEEVATYQREYRARQGKKKTAAINREQHLRRYGITPAEYGEMLEVQDGKCAICGATPEENGRRLCVDHNHKIGMTRGLLCTNCNHGLGKFQDSPDRLHNAAAYLLNWR